MSKHSPLQSYCLEQMQISRWQEFSQQAISHCSKYTIYYETNDSRAEQDVALLNNITRALGWAQQDINFLVIAQDFDVSDLPKSGVVVFFGLQTAVKFGLIQQLTVQQSSNIIFCASPQSMSSHVAHKRQVWEILKPLKV